MITLLLILLPLIGAFLLLFLKGRPQSFTKNVALILALSEFLIFIYAACGFAKNKGQLLFSADWVKELGIKFQVNLDGISLLMVGLTSFLIPLVILSSYRVAYKNASVLYALILFTQSALVGVFAADDIFLFYFCFEAALIPVYFLATYWGGERGPKITFKMFVYTMFGSLLMLVAFVTLYMRGQTPDIAALKQTAVLLPPALQHLLFGAFFIAFAIKMPVFPFHTWQPDAYTESPTPATMLLSGLLSKMGVFGLIRILLPLSPAGFKDYATIAIVLSLIGLVYGSIIAIRQNNIKRMIAYSSFAHMGLMSAGVFTGNLSGIQGAILQMLAHGINAVGLFFILKIIYDRTGRRDLPSLGGITQKAPVLSVLFMIILLGSVALPLTNGFIGEFLLLKGVFDFNPYFGAFAGLTIILGAVYMLRLMQRSMFGNITHNTENFTDLKTSEFLVLAPIAAAVILMGVFPNFFLKISEPVVLNLLQLAK